MLGDSCVLMACRYSSYGRHFTKPVYLKMVTDLLCPYLKNEDTLVDFSCGANVFVPMCKREAAHQGKVIFGRAYDIITSHDLTDFHRCSWMDVKPGERAVFAAVIPG